MEEIYVYENKKRRIIVSLYLLIVTISCLLFSFISKMDSVPLDPAFWFKTIPVLWLIPFVAYAVCTVINIKNIFSKKPMIIINNEGIYYDDLSKGIIELKWSDIIDIKIINAQRGKFIGIYTKKKINDYFKKTYLLNYRMYGVQGYIGVPPISIREDGVKEKLEEILIYMNKYFLLKK